MKRWPIGETGDNQSLSLPLICKFARIFQSSVVVPKNSNVAVVNDIDICCITRLNFDRIANYKETRSKLQLKENAASSRRISDKRFNYSNAYYQKTIFFPCSKEFFIDMAMDYEILRSILNSVEVLETF